MKRNIKKIKLLLLEQNMTKTALAEKSGISRYNISTILRQGTCGPRTAAKLAKSLSIDASEIIEN